MAAASGTRHVRAVWSADPNSTATFIVDAGQARETRFTYDSQGRMTKTTFADQSYTTTAYDDFDRKIAETDAVGQTTAYVAIYASPPSVATVPAAVSGTIHLEVRFDSTSKREPCDRQNSSLFRVWLSARRS